MAQLIRSPKSASAWGRGDLDSYRIQVSSVEPDKFFPTPDPSIDHIDNDLLNYPPGNYTPGVSDLAARFLARLDNAATLHESSIDIFVVLVLELLGFAECPAITGLQQILPLFICGDPKRVAQTDVCLLYRSFYLMVIEDKTPRNHSNREAQVITQAIAAFQHNNGRRPHFGLNPLDNMTIPCVTLSGTCPTFYLVPITSALDDAVRVGILPTVETRVLRCETLATHRVQ